VTWLRGGFARMGFVGVRDGGAVLVEGFEAGVDTEAAAAAEAAASAFLDLRPFLLGDAVEAGTR